MQAEDAVSEVSDRENTYNFRCGCSGTAYTGSDSEPYICLSAVHRTYFSNGYFGAA